MSGKNISYFTPSITDDEISEVLDTLKSGWLTMGPKTIAFEEQIAEYTGAKYAVAVNSCTAALHLSLIGLGIGSGDEVITTPFTFASTGNVIVHTGAKPVFVDIQPDTYNIDPELIKEAITPKTKAIIPVHYAGQPCDIQAITEIASDYNVKVIEDAAHAIGAEYKGNKIGCFGDTTCFSFYATKNMTTGDGGAVTTNDKKLADRMRSLRLHGITKDAWKRYSDQGSWYYEIEVCGWKYNMTDIQAAIGLHQIKKLDEFCNIRREYADMYNKALSDCDGLITPRIVGDVKHVFHLYPLLLEDYDRSQFIKHMNSAGIGCSVHFIPLHLHPFYREAYGFTYGDYPVAESVYEREVSLPLYPKMPLTDVHYVIQKTLEIIKHE